MRTILREHFNIVFYYKRITNIAENVILLVLLNCCSYESSFTWPDDSAAWATVTISSSASPDLAGLWRTWVVKKCGSAFLWGSGDLLPPQLKFGSLKWHFQQHYLARSNSSKLRFQMEHFLVFLRKILSKSEYFEQIEDARRRPTNTMLLVDFILKDWN